jgi:hypothetical protein
LRFKFLRGARRQSDAHRERQGLNGHGGSTAAGGHKGATVTEEEVDTVWVR